MFSAINLATILPEAVAMAIINDIAIAIFAAMAIDITLADATTVVIVHPYQEKKKKYIFSPT